MNKRSTRWFALLLAVAMVFSILPTAVFAEGKTQTYTKVTAAPKDWSGTYLIVSEGDSLIMDGSRTNLDVEGNKVDVTITEGKITGDYAKYAFTIAPMEGGYSVQSASGKYISGTSGKNKLNSNASPALNAISFADGKVKIVSNTTTLQYNNAATNGTRFRYYKSENQQPISLYKLEAAPARQSGIIKAEDIQNGDKVVVFNPVYGKTLSTEYSGYYNKGTDVTLAEGKLTGYTDADIWTVGVNKDGTYTFSTSDGQKLSMDASYTSTPLGKANDTWKVTAVDGKEATYYIDNTGRTDKYRLQWFTNNNNWSAYTGTGAAFEQQFYLVVDSGEEPDPDPDPEPTPSALFKDGEQIVIYNPANMKALSTEYSGFYNKGTDVTLTNGTLTGYTEADVWTVGVNADGSYTFSTKDGKKLSMGASYGSTPLDDVNTAWKVSPAATTGCYYIQNAVRGNYLEWYADKSNWSSYGSIGSNEALFAQAFYRVRKSGIVTSLSEGDTVVVFNPANMKALSTEYSGFYNKGTDVTLADGKLSGYTKADIWTVGVNEDGTYTFSTSEGKKLSMGASYGSTPLDDVNTAWNVTAAATENCFYIRNAVRGNYLEWYADKNNWSSYGKIGDEALFAQQFYLVVDDGSDQPSGDLPKPGDKFVIYNQNAQAVLAAENDTQSIEKAAAVIENGKAVPANGAVVFTVEQNGEYLRFSSEAYGYLCSNGTGNNAFYSKDFSEEGVTTDDADWLVRTCSGGVGGYEMESRVAKYSGHSQWLEYYADAFKTYSMYNVTDYTIYSFFFYPVAEGVNVTDGVVNAPAVDFGTILDAYVGQPYTLAFTVEAVFGVKTLTAKLGDKTLNITETENGYTVTIPTEDVKGDKLTVTVSGEDNKGVKFTQSAEIPVLDEPVISNVTPAQGAQTGTEKKPVISAEIANAGEAPTVTMTVNNETVNASYADGKVTYTPAAALADGRVTVTVTVKRADGKEASKTWSFTIGEATFQRYFGQLHSHTQYSDGAGSLESALSYVKNLPDTANVDFVAFTDHSNYFDSTSAANPEGALYDMSLASASSQQTWKSYKDAVAAFNAENAGSMVAMAGFEMTWSGGPGHINTFNTPGIVSRNNSTLNNKTKDAGLQAYYKLLSQPEGANALSQFNHPGTTFGNFIDFGYWDAVIDTRMYMVEVGNGEGQIGAGGYYPSYEQYIMALDKGWHVAPTNNQDNHKGRWGNANDARDVVLTDDFTEDGIYEAIRNRRMYATEDKNLELDYTVNGNMMGSIIDVPEKLSFEVSFNDPDRTDSIAKVELVANSGKVAYTWDNAADLAKGSVSVTLDPEYTYYFVRVTEGDGDLAVTAPVWVGESLKLGISKAECGTSTPVTDEELTITTTFFNSEAKPATIKSITYTIGNETIGTVTDAIALAASSTQDVEFKYTPTKARVMTVKITAVIEQDGKEYTFTKDVALDVLDADKLVYIGIDASHYNEYVAGNYKDSMGNFGELAAGYSVRTVMLKTSEELIAACGNAKFKGLILTAPSRRLADAQTDPRTYSEAELNAIKAFNENGGMVVLAGWSDNYENYDVIQNNPAIKHMAATQNEVLAALGSSLRISDDATYDDVRSAADGVDKWRLYFSAYNMENPLLKGVEFDAEHPFDKLYTERFSHYGGASIYAVDASGNPTSTMPATVSPVVYGHATTYSVDVDKDGLGGAATPKYTFADNDDRLMVMASEQLEGKGLIVVSGAAFMSNFEVQYQASDNGAEKNYSNYKICQNLLSMLNQTQIDKISDVQAEKDEGVKYTIEGIVTSNASGYDKDTAFFDCIYVQDNTAGINAFPVAGNFKIGDKVRITGTTSSYQGERQIAVTKIEKIADAEAPAPLDVTAAQVNDGSVLGTLVRVKGTITRVEEAEGKIQTIMVKDAAGNETRIFIDGYITKDKEVQNAVIGNQVEAVGLASYDNTFVLSDGTPVYPRIRIRDRDDVVCSKSDSKIWSVTLVTDGGTINSGNVTAYIEGVGAVLPTDVTRRNYIFLGWFTADNIRVTEISAADSGDKIFYAHWMAAGTIPGIIDAIGDSMCFDDVTKGDWFYKDVEYVYNEGIMDGVSKREFAPNETLTRAMIVKILYRIEGEPAGYRSSDFNDVESGRWYTGAVAWAAEKEIVKGYGNGKFGPNDPVTREQLAAILYRYTQYKGWSTAAASGNLDGFKDAASVSSYAVDAMNWAVDEGLLKGANNKLSPKSNATRAQVAAIIHRYLKG